MVNLTTPVVFTAQMFMDATYTCTDSAEWIIERPGVLSGTNTLANFGTENFDLCCAQLSEGSSYLRVADNSVGCYYFKIINPNSNNKVLADTNTLGSTGNFTATWHDYY